jgi:hypothetical protein
MGSTVFELRYKSWAALDRDLKEQISMGGLLIRTETELERLSQLTVRVVGPSGRTFELPGEVLQVVPGQGLAVQFSPEATTTLQKLTESTAGAPRDEPKGADDPAVTEAGATRTKAFFQGPPPEGVDLRTHVEQMSVNQKRQAALHGRRDMRLLLIRDRNKTIHPFVLKNPGITLDEVEQIAKMPSVNPEALRMIATSPDWTRVATVCRNLVRNPKTPLKDALALMGKLPMSDLRALAKSSNVKTQIQAAARKRVLK